MHYIPIPLKEVITFAKTIHEGQKDKAGVPYHEHLQYVADQVDTDLEKAVAWLHDSVEDGKTTLDEIKKKFGRDVGYIVWLLTKKEDEEYFEYIERLSKNPTARKIKLADLSHNSQLSRLPKVTQKDLERLEKYEKAIEMITDSEKLTTSAIIERGWSKSMVLKLLGEPEIISSFGYKKLTLYKKKDVIAAENTDEFKDLSPPP